MNRFHNIPSHLQRSTKIVHEKTHNHNPETCPACKEDKQMVKYLKNQNEVARKLCRDQLEVIDKLRKIVEGQRAEICSVRATLNG